MLLVHISGDLILQSGEPYKVSPLQLYAITNRLKLPEPTCGQLLFVLTSVSCPLLFGYFVKNVSFWVLIRCHMIFCQ